MTDIEKISEAFFNYHSMRDDRVKKMQRIRFRRAIDRCIFIIKVRRACKGFKKPYKPFQRKKVERILEKYRRKNRLRQAA